MSAPHTKHLPLPEGVTPPDEATRELAAVRARDRRPWAVAAGVGFAAIVIALAVSAMTASDLSATLAATCTAAGPNTPPEVSSDCQQAQRGEIPVAAAGVPGLDGRNPDTAVTVPPALPGAPATVYPAGPAPRVVPGVPGPVQTILAPRGDVPDLQTVTVTPEAPLPASPKPQETVTVTGPPGEPVTVIPPPETRTETAAPETRTETSTTTVTETVTVTAEPGPPPPGEEPQGPPPGEEQPPPVTTSGAPAPADPGPVEEPAPGPTVSPVSASGPTGQDPAVLEHLLGFGLGM